MLFLTIPAIALAFLGSVSPANADTLTRYLVYCGTSTTSPTSQWDGFYYEIQYDSWRLGSPMSFLAESSCASQVGTNGCLALELLHFTDQSNHAGHTFTYDPALTHKDRYKLDGSGYKTLPSSGAKPIDVGNNYPQSVCDNLSQKNGGDKMYPVTTVAETYYNLPNI
jgi:hypothetical protein